MLYFHRTRERTINQIQSQQKEIKYKAEINDVKNTNRKKKISKAKSCFFGKSYKIDKPLAILRKKEIKSEMREHYN